MLILPADAADLLSCRFAISPLWELGAAVRITHQDPEQRWHEDWLAAVRDLSRPAGLTVLQAMQPARGYSPDFLAPPPADPDTTFDGEIDRVARTPVDRVLDELLRCRTDHLDAAACTVLDRLIADPVAARAEIVLALRSCWDSLLAPHWPRLRRMLDRDVAYRARRLADHGVATVLDELHPDVRYHQGAVEVDWRRRTRRQQRDVSGAGLVLMPSAFTWPRARAILDPPWQPTVIYPARGIADLWRSGPPAAPRALTGVLGASRARLLVDLAEPADTTTLAHRHAMAASAVSRHLHALRDAGLLTAQRDRRRVLYHRTALGTALCTAQEPTTR